MMPDVEAAAPVAATYGAVPLPLASGDAHDHHLLQTHKARALYVVLGAVVLLVGCAALLPRAAVGGSATNLDATTYYGAPGGGYPQYGAPGGYGGYGAPGSDPYGIGAGKAAAAQDEKGAIGNHRGVETCLQSFCNKAVGALMAHSMDPTVHEVQRCLEYAQSNATAADACMTPSDPNATFPEEREGLRLCGVCNKCIVSTTPLSVDCNDVDGAYWPGLNTYNNNIYGQAVGDNKYWHGEFGPPGGVGGGLPADALPAPGAPANAPAP